MGSKQGDEREPTGSNPWSRRRFLELLCGGGIGASVLRVGNELVGFGTISGTNVTEQSLADYARERLEPTSFDLDFEGHQLVFDGELVEVRTEAGDSRTAVPVTGVDPHTAAYRGAEVGLRAPLRNLASDLSTIAAGAVSIEGMRNDQFFERVGRATPRPLTVAALRGEGFRQPDLDALRQFAGVDPSETVSLVPGLAAGFEANTHFDVSRYVVGNVQEHALSGSIEVRQTLEGPETFAGLAAGDVGLYCWEYTLRSIEAFHAVAPHHQSVPVFGATVRDHRHNHMYTALASVVRADGELSIPMTLIDYSHASLYENFSLQFVLGRGIDAYDTRHRVSDIYY